MHLLTETALGDSRDFEILSYEQLEELKRTKTQLKYRLDAIDRKIALETKLRDAAQSLNRLYSTRRPGSGQSVRADGTSESPRQQRRSILGSQHGVSDALARTEDEFAASSKKILELGQERSRLARSLDETRRRILEHTAGVLQLTHKGLKKNSRKAELPRSPESMASPNNRAIQGFDGSDEFDERSLYHISDYVTDFGLSPFSKANTQTATQSSKILSDAEKRLFDLSGRLYAIVEKTSSEMEIAKPPQPPGPGTISQPGDKIQACLDYVAKGLDAVEADRAQLATERQRSLLEHEGQIEGVNGRLKDMLDRTKSGDHEQGSLPQTAGGKGMQSLLEFSSVILDSLSDRVQLLVEQKDILTRQIQQQRELNSKSDSQRDTQIRSLTDQLSEVKQLHALGEQEAQKSREHIAMLVKQLDDANHELTAAAIQIKASDNQFQADRQALQQAKDQRESELESEVVRVQTELTVVKAELDAAYGTRAQRAAEISADLQKDVNDLKEQNAQLESQLEEAKGAGVAELQNQVNALHTELKETIEDYEIMTRASIEFEKERDSFEATIDALRERCEALETQLNDEKVKWLGFKANAPHETTSVMVLRNEFKRMMRESRTDGVKALRVRLLTIDRVDKLTQVFRPSRKNDDASRFS